MITPTTKKALVFVSAGLGDAILLVPLVHLLRRQGYWVTGLFTSVFPCEQLFADSTVFDDLLIARSNPRKAFLALKEYRNYQLAIVNYFASTRSNLLLAQKMATMVHTNRIPDKAGRKLVQGVVYFKPVEGIHDTAQNILLAGKGAFQITPDLLKIDSRAETKLTMSLPERFIVLQLSAGNNAIQYKNWAIDNWIRFLTLAASRFSGLHFLILGDAAEKNLAHEVILANTRNVSSLTGMTTVGEAARIISKSILFAGLDGGLMHLAASKGIPTFTLWGPSNQVLYGYAGIDPDMHRVVSLNLSCSPCSSWISANTSRYSGPEQCQAKECLSKLGVDQVFGEFSTFVKKHGLV